MITHIRQRLQQYWDAETTVTAQCSSCSSATTPAITNTSRRRPEESARGGDCCCSAEQQLKPQTQQQLMLPTGSNDRTDDDNSKKPRSSSHLLRSRSLMIWNNCVFASSVQHSLKSGSCCFYMLIRFLPPILALALVIFVLTYPRMRHRYFLHMRTSLPFISRRMRDGGAFDPLPASQTCIVQALDRSSKKVYGEFMQKNKAWAQKMGYSYHEYLRELHPYHTNSKHKDRTVLSQHNYNDKNTPSASVSLRNHAKDYPHFHSPWSKIDFLAHSPKFDLEAPHYLKYHAIQYLFASEQYTCNYVIYIDSDSVVYHNNNDDDDNNERGGNNYYNDDDKTASLVIPRVPHVDILFGNEVFLSAMLEMDKEPDQLPFNSGFLLMRKSDFAKRFIQDVLHNPRCDICRDGPCTIFGLYDQGCIEKLLNNEYAQQHHKLGVVQIQNTARKGRGFLFCHLAGLKKAHRKHSCLEGRQQ